MNNREFLAQYQALRPEEIERRSLAIITEELGGRSLDPLQEPIIKRVIHTTADFDYADSLYFSPGAVERATELLRAGAGIVCDTNMVKAGINKAALQKLGGQVHCFMADEGVASEAKRRGVTRASVSMERAAALPGPLVFAIGNAPTALIRLRELMGEGRVRPGLVIGVPVGFVHVVESKELFVDTGDVPAIIARGRKGGSNVAAAICNALLYTLTR